jgi:hypothetical protein
MATRFRLITGSSGEIEMEVNHLLDNGAKVLDLQLSTDVVGDTSGATVAILFVPNYYKRPVFMDDDPLVSDDASNVPPPT